MIEVDDSSHDWRDEADRNEYIKSQGFAILRINNGEIASGAIDIHDTVSAAVQAIQAGASPAEIDEW